MRLSAPVARTFTTWSGDWESSKGANQFRHTAHPGAVAPIHRVIAARAGRAVIRGQQQHHGHDLLDALAVRSQAAQYAISGGVPDTRDSRSPPPTGAARDPDPGGQLERSREMRGAARRRARRDDRGVHRHAAAGRDPAHGRGSSAYDRFYGDPAVRPNPNLAPLTSPPFYAIPIQPGDIGTNGGLRTSEHAQVIDERALPIAGLYATGNTTASVMGHSYPGARVPPLGRR